jgi:hypothetical protein
MAGKTLPGIGEDESGEHDAADKSDSSLRLGAGATGGLTGARSTDRMPLTIPVATGFSGPTVVDDDKVAEGLKKLRSLDEPLGPTPMATMTTGTIQPGMLAPPSSTTIQPGTMAPMTPVSSMPTVKEGTPTLKEGMPAVGAAPPVITPAVAAAELLRSRGTAHGHALSGNSVNPALLPVAIDDRMKGTLLGHSLHLPDLPEPGSEEKPASPRPAEVRSIAAVQQVPPAGALRPSEMVADFSNGDARFFESDATSTDFESERPRPNLMFRGVVFFAVVSVFAVAAFAWVNARNKSEPEAQVAAPAPAPEPAAAVEPHPAAPVAAEPAPAAAAPTEPAPAVPVAAEPAPTPAPAVAEPAAAPPPDSPAAKMKRQLAAVQASKEAKAELPKELRPARPASPAPARPARHTESTRDVPPPVAKPTPSPTPTAKHGKSVEDPDGTLPLSD